MSERILRGVLHNVAENVILITISDKVKTETLKKIYNISIFSLFVKAFYSITNSSTIECNIISVVNSITP